MPAHYPLHIPQCEHIMDTGFRCGSPALKGQPFCYHHHDVHACRPKVGNKGYKFRPLETAKSVTLQLADIAQAAHDGTISLQLARTLFYYVQLGAPYVSRSGGYRGDVETELTPAMEASRTADHLAIGSSEHIEAVSVTGDGPINNNQSPINNPTPNTAVMPSIANSQSPIVNPDEPMSRSSDGQMKKRPRYYDPEGCLAFLTKEG